MHNGEQSEDLSGTQRTRTAGTPPRYPRDFAPQYQSSRMKPTLFLSAGLLNSVRDFGLSAPQARPIGGFTGVRGQLPASITQIEPGYVRPQSARETGVSHRSGRSAEAF